MCLASLLLDLTERGVYAASAWHNPRHVPEFPEHQENADGEAA